MSTEPAPEPLGRWRWSQGGMVRDEAGEFVRRALAAPSSVTPDLRAAIEATTPLINPRLSEVDWDAVAAALRRSDNDPTYYAGRPDTLEESRRIAEALGEHRRKSS